MSRFTITKLPIQGLKLITRIRLGDKRGFFERMFCSHEFTASGLLKHLEQINVSFTAQRGTVRGMHFQYKPSAEIKVVSCLQGDVWDVAVDLRKGSPSFMQWHAELLSDRNYSSLFIPEGVAHGFQTLTDKCKLLYFHSVAYDPHAEGAVSPLDPRVGIDWPLEIKEISDRDQNHPLLLKDFEGVEI